jgi:hypothetical protein
LGGCAESGEQDDGGEQRPQVHGGLLRQRDALRLAVHLEHAGLRLDGLQLPAPSASPSRSSRAPSEAAAVEATDRKRSPPRSSTPSTWNGGSGTLGLVAPEHAGERRMPPAGSSQAGFDCVHARLQRLQVDGQGLAIGLFEARHPFVQRLPRGGEVGLADRRRPALRAFGLLFEIGHAQAQRLHLGILCAALGLLGERDRPTLLMSATALMSTSQKAAEILSQRVRELRSDGAWEGHGCISSGRSASGTAWRCRAGWRKGRREHRAG